MRVIDRLVVHCSDSPDTQADIDVNEIRRWHVVGNGWKDVGYHYVIRRDGTIEAGRMESVVGAHVESFNADSLGICWVGRHHMTGEQHAALLKLLRELMERYKLGISCVFGHKELDPKKTCPNLDMAKLRKELA